MTKRPHNKQSHLSSETINNSLITNNTRNQSNMIASLINIRFIRFLIVGVVNTGFSYGVYSLLIYSGVEYRQATLGALIAGIFFSFKTQGKFVFNNSENRLFFRFLFCWIIIYFFNIYFIERMLLLGFNAYEAGAIALAPVTVFSFLVQKLIVFRKSPTVQELAISSEAAVFPVTYKQTHLAIVIPCYNEEEVLSETNVRLLKLLEDMLASGLIAAESSIYYVDDGSRDKTWDLISGFHRQNPQVHGVKLSRNRGHQNALLAGLFSANGQAVISIDADLQDDIEVIKDMLYRYNEGYEIVYGVRSSRKTDSLFKRTTAQFYYKVLKMMGVELVYNHADYRLMSQRVIECLKDYHEVNLFLRGIIPQLGFKYTTVFYERNERFAGESKYPLRKMLALAADGITSFSVLPLRMITWLGLWVSFGSLLMVVWILVGKYFMQTTIPGWASSVLPIYFIGGIQLLSIGILGEYLAKIYMETKQRPRYFIDEVI